jgi:hypothetical protein
MSTQAPLDSDEAIVRRLGELLRESEQLRNQIDLAQEAERGSYFRDRRQSDRRQSPERRREDRRLRPADEDSP